VRGEELEGYRTRARVAAAAAAQARVALERARLDATDAQVRAPVEGLIQTRTVQTGQYVQPGTVLATLVRRDPLLLRFTVPESDARRLSPGLVAAFRIGGRPTDFRATLRAVADAADAESRMVAVTAHVEGADDPALRPGAFAEVSVPVGSRADAPVIPQTAVRPSERGFLAFVLEGDLVRERVLDLGMRTPDGLVEVRSGLRPGESLVVRGAEALRDGAQVRVAGPNGLAPPMPPGPR
jgi:multidrug efflux system membrane fusion protein